MRKKQKKKNTKLQTLTYINIIGIIIGCAIYHLKKKKVLTWHLRKGKLEFSDLNARKKLTIYFYIVYVIISIFFFFIFQTSLISNIRFSGPPLHLIYFFF